MSEPLLSIVVLSYNRDDIIKKNLSSLIEFNKYIRDSDYEVILVDNDSKDSTRSIIESEVWPDNFNFLFNNVNLGVAKGRNEGIIKAKGSWILILDDDSILSESAIPNLISTIKIPEGVGLLALNVKDMNSSVLVSDILLSNELISNFHGAGHVISRKLINEIGYLDTECTFGGEELDYTIRCRNAGMKLLFLENVIVEHYCKPRKGNEGLDRRLKWLYNYTRIIFKHFPMDLALKFSIRYLVTYLYSSVKVFGVKVVPAILKAYLRGRSQGRSAYISNTEKTVEFYRNSLNRPEYGNVGILRKALNGK